MDPDLTKTEMLLHGGSASELAGEKMLTRIYLASLTPYETAARLRRYFRIGPHYWALISAT